MHHTIYNIAIISLVVSVICAATIAFDILNGRRQHMWIMNIVWPVTALYAGPLGLIAYVAFGRAPIGQKMAGMEGHRHPQKQKPFWQSVVVGATHCGAGCTLGDLLAEWFLFFVPLSFFGQQIFTAWLIDFVAAFILGIAFQYFTIKPMRNLTARQGLIAALKADTLSLTAWQVGMYGWMALVVFVFFDHTPEKNGPIFWSMMQVAMLCGFATSYGVNWWLLRSGIKETM